MLCEILAVVAFDQQMALVFRVFPCRQSCFKAIISNVLKIQKALFVSSLVQIIFIILLGTQLMFCVCVAQ